MTGDLDRLLGSVGKLLGMGDRKKGLGDFALDLLLVAGMVRKLVHQRSGGVLGGLTMTL